MIALARRFALPWALTAGVLFAFWLLFTDTVEEASNYVGIGAAALGATASELVRQQRIAVVRPRARWLLRGWRPLASVPGDLWKLTAEALRALPFDSVGDAPRDNARRAAAEIAGSFSPNTLVVGIDVERGEILVHQLVPDTNSPESSIDPLGVR